MKSRGLSWGIFLVVVGALLVLRNFNIMEFDVRWSDVARFWPLGLVFIGLSSLTKTESLSKYQWLVPVMLVILIVLFFVKGVNWNSNSSDSHWLHSNKSDTSYTNQNFKVDYLVDTKLANLTFNGGAASFYIEDTTSDLLEANTTFKGSEYMLEKVHVDSTENITMKMNNDHFKMRDGEWDNKVNMKLNNQPLWNMDFSFGAGEVVFDLSPYRIKKFDMDAGAASLDLKLSALVDGTFDINAGASSLIIRIPKEAKCNLKLDAVLSSKTLEGFTIVDENEYISEGVGANAKVLNISIDAGVSSVEIVRY